MPQTIKLNSPLKGVNRAFGREAQPPNTCWDALNVMPSDRYGRLRVAQRSGIGALDTLGSDPVRLLHVASTINGDVGLGDSFQFQETFTYPDGDLPDAPIMLLTEPFTYANGDLGAQSTWDTFDENDVSVSNGLVVATNQVTAGAGDYQRAYALGTTAVTFGTNWDITLDVVSGASTANFYQVALFMNFDTGIGDTTLVRVVFTIPRNGTPSTVTLATENQSGSLIGTGPMFAPNTTSTIGLRQRGNTITATIGGASLINVVELSPRAFNGANSYGFAIDGADGSLDPATVDNFDVFTPGANGWYSDPFFTDNLKVSSNAVIGDPASGFNGNYNANALTGFDPGAQDFSMSFNFKANSGANPLSSDPSIGIGWNDGGFGFTMNVIRTASVAEISINLNTSAGFGDTAVSIPFTEDVFHTIRTDYTAADFTSRVYLDDVLKVTVDNTVPLDANPLPLFLDIGMTNDHVITVDDLSISFSGGGTASLNRTILKLVATAGDTTYVGDPTAMNAATNSGAFPIDPAAIFVSAATLFGFTYIVDGANIRKLDLSTNTMVAYTESGGTKPAGVQIACSWRGRFVVSGADADPQNVFFSKAGDPMGWDYGDGTPISAFTANASTSGRIGAPVVALIPVSEDMLVIGCEQSMWAVRGDPADGGSILQITDFAGISSATAWTRAPDGSIYFIGPRGLFRMNASATEVTEISQTTYPQYFQNINRATNFINLMYDADRYGIWMFVSPATQGNVATSMFLDLRADGLWPQNFSSQLNAGPICCVWWDGFDSDTRYPVLGGYDSILYAMNHTNRTDNGGAINSYIVLGPIRPSDRECILIGTTINLGELSPADLAVPSRWNSNFTIKAGHSAYDVTEGTADISGVATWGSQGRTKTLRQRLRGEWFSIRLSNGAASNYFSMESVDMEFDTKGRNRRQGL